MSHHADPKDIFAQPQELPYEDPLTDSPHVCTNPIYPTWRDKFEDPYRHEDIPRWLTRSLTCEIIAPISNLLRQISKINVHAADDYQMHLEAATTFAAMRLTRAIPREITSIDDMAQRMLVGAGLCCPEMLRDFLLEDALHHGTLHTIRRAFPDFDPVAYLDRFYPEQTQAPESHGERPESPEPNFDYLGG